MYNNIEIYYINHVYSNTYKLHWNLKLSYENDWNEQSIEYFSSYQYKSHIKGQCVSLDGKYKNFFRIIKFKLIHGLHNIFDKTPSRFEYMSKYDHKTQLCSNNYPNQFIYYIYIYWIINYFEFINTINLNCSEGFIDKIIFTRIVSKIQAPVSWKRDWEFQKRAKGTQCFKNKLYWNLDCRRRLWCW